MPRAVYSTLFFSHSSVVANSIAAYTVPLERVAIVSDFDVFLLAGAGNLIGLYDSVMGSSFFGVTPPAVNASAQWRGHQVWPAGASFGWALSGGTWNVRCSGYLLVA